MPDTMANQFRLLWAGQFQLLSQADCYARGLHVERDDVVALAFYQEALRRRLPNAHFKLATFLRARPELPGSMAQACAAYFEAFLAGNRDAKVALEELAGAHQGVGQYFWGRVAEHEERWLEAEACYKAAADNGYVLASFQRAKLYSTDHLAPGSADIVMARDLNQELLLYKYAAALGCREGLSALEAMVEVDVQVPLYLGQLYELSLYRSYEKSVEYYKKSSIKGLGLASIRLGVIFEGGLLGSSSDMLVVFDYYERALVQGHEEALELLIKLVERTRNSQLQYKLALVYLQIVKNLTQAALYFKQAINQGCAEARPHAERVAALDANFSYILACSFSSDGLNAATINLCYHYYALATRNGHEEAKNRLEALAVANESHAQYALAVDYYHYLNKHEEAANLCMRAAELGHPQAWIYLTKTVFNKALSLRIAACYEKGDGVLVNLSRAAHFYDAAIKLGDRAASLHLAELYQTGGPAFPINLIKACHYYHHAASHGCLSSLEKLKDLLEESPDHENQFKLAELLYRNFHDHAQAITWYIKAADQGSISAKTSLRSIAASNVERAFEIAQVYAAHANEDESLFFYYQAARSGHVPSRSYIEAQADAGVVNAHYGLSNLYFELRIKEDLPVLWLVRAAEKNHTAALTKLNTTHWSCATYLSIAKMYHTGEHLARNYPRAIEFYEKAYLTGDSASALTLGRLYESQSSVNDENLNRALHYYQESAKSGLGEAADALVRLHSLVYRLTAVSSANSIVSFQRVRPASVLVSDSRHILTLR